MYNIEIIKQSYSAAINTVSFMRMTTNIESGTPEYHEYKIEYWANDGKSSRGNTTGLNFIADGNVMLSLNNFQNAVVVPKIMNTNGVEYALKTDIPEMNEVDLSGYVLKSEKNIFDMTEAPIKLSKWYGLDIKFFNDREDMRVEINKSGTADLNLKFNKLHFENLEGDSTMNMSYSSFTVDTMNTQFSVRKNVIHLISSTNKVIFQIGMYDTEECYMELGGQKVVTENQLQQSMTITHLAPIDEELDINSFVIGAPVYMTGKVYVKDWKNKCWNISTVNNTIDCISSVKTNGTWKEYLGICTHILPETREIKFATHGDFLVKVDDSSTYGIGDTVYIEHVMRNNMNIPILKILSEDIPLTTKINRMTVGVVSSIIDSRTISVIRE